MPRRSRPVRRRPGSARRSEDSPRRRASHPATAAQTRAYPRRRVRWRRRRCTRHAGRPSVRSCSSTTLRSQCPRRVRPGRSRPSSMRHRRRTRWRASTVPRSFLRTVSSPGCGLGSGGSSPAGVQASGSLPQRAPRRSPSSRCTSTPRRNGNCRSMGQALDRPPGTTGRQRTVAAAGERTVASVRGRRAVEPATRRHGVWQGCPSVGAGAGSASVRVTPRRCRAARRPGRWWVRSPSPAGGQAPCRRRAPARATT